MLPRLALRLLRGTAPRCLGKLVWNFGVKGVLSVERFKRRLRAGEWFPPFLHLSILNSCNLRCLGCWVDVAAPRRMLSPATLHRLITEAKGHGNVFFGILGGEPLLYPQLVEVLAAHPDCYFQLFTNGHLLTAELAGRLRRLGNVSPLVSLEGRARVSDERRGGRDVFAKSLRGLEECVRAGLFTGVATSLCQSNFAELLTEAWLDELIARGVHYVWFYNYRPAGPQPAFELALRPEQTRQARRFIVEMRARKPIILVDAYYDHAGRALCPMATGIALHIGPGGDLEPCPVIQLAAETLRDNGSLFELTRRSAFLRDFREVAARHTRGCIVLERPDLMRELVRRHGARDTTARGTVLAELAAMAPRSSQWQPGEEIPEGHWFYRWVKRHWYHDFGVYRELDQAGPRPSRAR